MSISLAEVLTVEHRAIDAGIEKFVATPPGASVAEWAAPLTDAMTALRRHIYLEEELVFPQLSTGPLMMPIMVMLREHGDMWRTMASLDAALAADDVDVEPQRGEVISACTAMLALLEAHNSKEEPVIYPHLDADLDEDAQAFLRDFLDGGTMPDGWECAKAAA
ncbi:hemerythrin domain-containing protein [Gordonia shandongensis]|uniref:hemerythrin domain-containing protein n=1 Tax=Gordonia shandongensis TaxID=376351 RepID=UPI00041C4DC2|nr:hemerythrin domain-containing protein [Gordonia shandongensis]